MRLVSKSGQHKGRVELFLLGQWGTVCDYDWDFVDAMVVCKELGYLRAVGAPRDSAFGAGSGPSWYSHVQCTGSENSVKECRHYGYFGRACPHSQDAGVVCSGESLYILFMHANWMNLYCIYIIQHENLLRIFSGLLK